MARGIGIGDLVAITAIVRRRVTEDRVSVSIPSYNFPHSIIDEFGCGWIAVACVAKPPIG
ncbi:MAG: hypothetical protein EOS11_15450 [Mesorhizobium sp.]|nr:MAG: hypothetical protein EOS11_15450 [Mesorhizobium sp.]